MRPTIKLSVQEWLKDRNYEAGQTVQFGWFVFRIANDECPPQLETLDFRSVASFSTDFSEVEKVNASQQEALIAIGRAGEPCSLRNSALVSLSYSPDRKDAFLKRDDPVIGNASGWYVGVEDENLNINEAGSFILKSLYELSIHDRRMIPYWLLPVGSLVRLDAQLVELTT